MISLIEKKKNKKELTASEIEGLVRSITEGSVRDYQLASLLMAIRLNGMSEEETTALTLAMAHSGKVLDLSAFAHTVDKHSSGGVSDAVTLICAPIMASCGLTVAKLSGRGLGFTGGTIDKLEAFCGFDAYLSTASFFSQLQKLGLAVCAQTEELAPADASLYALRDVTATVDSIPLIASSIMSKKIASGANIIILDVKYGSGAFLKTPQQAQDLASIMVKIGKNLGKKTSALITSMEQPLGEYVGSNLEVNGAIEALRGKNSELASLSLTIAQEALSQANMDSSMAKEALSSGKALHKLKEMVAEQGGSWQDSLPHAQYVVEVFPSASGFVSKIDSADLGNINIALGGGRVAKNQPIDHTVGLQVLARLGQEVRENQPIGRIFSTKQNNEELVRRFASAFQISQTAPKPIQTIFGRV